MAFSEWPAGVGSSDLEERVRACIAMITDGTTAAQGDIRGLEDHRILEIEKDQPARLSDAYRWFLSLAGGGAGRFLQGSDVFHPDVLGLRAQARELLEDNDADFELQDTDRVILMHDGCQFDFLRGSGPDPEVWSYCEYASEPRCSHAHFSDWLRANAEEQTAVWAKLDQIGPVLDQISPAR